MSSPVPVAFTTLSGKEMLRAFGVLPNGQPSGEDFYLNTAQIAALANEEGSLAETAVSATTGTTLTAAALVGGQISRTGPTAAFSDTTDSAADILAALPSVVVGSSFLIRIKNGTNYTETLLAGLGVTLPVTVTVPPLSVGNYFATVSTATTITLVHMSTTPLNPVGGVTTAVGGSIGGVATGTFSQASNTTLSSVTGMVAQLTAGATYAFLGYLATTNSATGGIKLGLNGGTATATSFLADTWTYSGTTLESETNVSAISSSLVDFATACTAVLIKGTIVVNAGGTVQLQAAQHASNSTATTVTNLSSIVFTRIA